MWTDQQDYSPGDIVTISGDNRDGAGFMAGETVQVDVRAPSGYASACDSAVDETGAWPCQVILWPDYLDVGTSNYTATRMISNILLTGVFTDGI